MTVNLDVLRKTAEELLRNRGVFDIEAFGWRGEDDVDPEFAGYASWIQSPPYDYDFAGRHNNTVPSLAPTEREQKLMEHGEDFLGLMKTSRYFIGHALLQQPAVQTIQTGAPTVFDFNEFAALVALTAAADRLSDFIIVTALGKKTDKKEERNMACAKLREEGLKIEADELQEGFKAISRAREARRIAVHGLATQPAHRQKLLITEDREAFEKQQWPCPIDYEMPLEDLIRGGEQAETEERAELGTRANLLCD